MFHWCFWWIKCFTGAFFLPHGFATGASCDEPGVGGLEHINTLHLKVNGQKYIQLVRFELEQKLKDELFIDNI